jgi:hypothetical protein
MRVIKGRRRRKRKKMTRLVETKRTKVGKDLTSDHKDGGKHDVAAAL